jgi:hypothetical protein
MTVELNHTIVHVKDKVASAAFYAERLGVGAPVPYEDFLTVALANNVTLDFLDARCESSSQHYAFLVSEDDFD